MEPARSLYDSRSKVLMAAPGTRTDTLDGLPNVDVYNLRLNGERIVATGRDGSEHALSAPAAGAVVVVADGPEDAVARALTRTWEGAGFAPPEIVMPGATEPAEVRARILEKIVAQLGAELERTARDAVELDRQIAALREEVEDARSALWDVRAQLRLTGARPVETLTRDMIGARHPLAAGEEAVQTLPFPPHLVRAFALSFDPRNRAFYDGARVLIRLVAREDGAELGRWVITEDEVEDTHRGWVVCALAPSPRRYRYADLVLRAEGAAGTHPQLNLADAAGEARAELRLGDRALSGQMAALRLWTGEAFRMEGVGAGFLWPMLEDQLDGGPMHARVPRKSFDAIRTLSKPREDIEWFRRDGSSLFLHPTPSMPSVVAMPLSMTPGIRGISTRLELAHERAFPTEFAIVASPFELDRGQVAALCEAGADPGRTAIARLPWTDVLAGTSRPVELEFSQPMGEVTLYFATRMAGERVDFAHAWFRDVMVRQ